MGSVQSTDKRDKSIKKCVYVPRHNVNPGLTNLHCQERLTIVMTKDAVKWVKWRNILTFFL